MTPAVECIDLSVAHGSVRAVAHVDLTVSPGTTVALLGPSGSGKTTLLSAIAGFLTPTTGEIHMAGRLVATPESIEPPERRQVGVVFQHYALWPHMTALETVAYPFRRDGIARSEAERHAADLLQRMGVAHLAGRRPAELSGGERQRVGLARALARRAPLYLFDEPTAHLDAPLRTSLQEELLGLYGETGSAVLYATHDAGEALAVADHVAILREGTVVQEGTPTQVYEEPSSLWTARLTGPARVLEADTRPLASGKVAVTFDGTTVEVPGGGGGGRALVRPDWVALGGPLHARVEQVRYRGSHTDYRLATGGGTVDLRRAGPPWARAGEDVTWRLERVWLVEP